MNYFFQTLPRFATYLLVNNNLWVKLVSPSELPIIFENNLKTTYVLFFISDFNLLNCELYSFTFKLLH